MCRTCLEPDFEPHRKQYTLPALATTVAAQQALKYYKHMSLVVMRQGALHIAKFAPNAQPSPTPKRVRVVFTGRTLIADNMMGENLPVLTTVEYEA